MGGFWSKDDLSADFVQELMDETGFNQKQIHRLYIRFRHLDKDKKGYLTKEDLLRLPQMNMNPVGEKIVETFLPPKEFDENNKEIRRNKRIFFSQFAKTFAVFRPIHRHDMDKHEAPNSKTNKIRFLFNMINSAGNGKVTKDEMNEVLELMVGSQVSQEQLEMIADRLIKEADQDGHGYMKFEEFEKAINDIDVEGKMAFVSFY